MSTELDLYTQDRAARTVPFDSVAFERTFHHEVATLESGVRIHYVRGGTGAPVVLLHGFPQHWREWRPVMPALAAAGHDVIAPDLRGFGESDKPLTDVDARTVAEDLRQLLHLPTREPIAVVGHDVDASVAYAWAARHPQSAAHNRELSRLKLGMPVLAIGSATTFGQPMAEAATSSASSVQRKHSSGWWTSPSSANSWCAQCNRAPALGR